MSALPCRLNYLPLVLALLLLAPAPGGNSVTLAAGSAPTCTMALTPISRTAVDLEPGETTTFTLSLQITVSGVTFVSADIYATTVSSELTVTVSPATWQFNPSAPSTQQTYSQNISVVTTLSAAATPGQQFVINTSAAAVCETFSGFFNLEVGGPRLSVTAAMPPTPTPTFTPTSTPTATPTFTSTPTATDTPQPTATFTPTATSTNTPTTPPTATNTPTLTPTATQTSTPTPTSTATPTATEPSSPTSSASPTTSATTAQPSPTDTTDGLQSTVSPVTPSGQTIAPGTATSPPDPPGTITAGGTQQQTATDQTPFTATVDQPPTTAALGQVTAGTQADLSQAAEGEALTEGVAASIEFQITQETQETSAGDRWLRWIAIPAGLALLALGGFGIWRNWRRPV